MANLELSFAFAENQRSRPILEGTIAPEGIDLRCTRSGMQELAWRQFHAQEFDASELSMSSMIAARSRGDDTFVALPIFTTRSFMQTNVLVSEAAGINSPEDLIGKRIGVPEYQQTAALWARGILQHEYGVDPTACHWYMERLPEQSHGGSTGFEPPAGLDFQYIPWEKNIVEMMVAGELDASLLGGSWGVLAPSANSLRRKSIVNENRGTTRLGPGSGVRPLFASPRAEGARYYAKTGIFPVNHGFAVQREVLDKNPWVALNIYQAFLEAKDVWLGELGDATRPFLDTGVLNEDASKGLEEDLFPYGVRANRKLLETLIDYSFEQGLSERRIQVEELFYAPTLDL
jgi:4,5-dihydroxyphthalate decarboxylase